MSPEYSQFIEPGAEECYQHNVTLAIQLSIAISTKRMADAFEKFAKDGLTSELYNALTDHRFNGRNER